jgi:ubiquinone/menaquinone biosynthesis C-methylase UbiE
MLPYQSQIVDTFVKMLRPDTRDILEIGSDIGCEVATAVAQRTGANVVGINPSEEFPVPVGHVVSNAKFMRADGRCLPFPDNSFDAVLSVATMEHVNGLDVFLAEVARVLKHKGFFYTEFSPIWSSAKGHHVYAVVGPKEARFWKPGKNPIPDYAHLLMTPDEMREYLRSGPCTEELIEPIIQWVYFGDSLNRCHYEEYMESFRKIPLAIQAMRFGYDSPDNETLASLRLKYGPGREFSCSSISTILRKPPEGFQGMVFRTYIESRKNISCWSKRQMKKTVQIIRMLLSRFFSL